MDTSMLPFGKIKRLIDKLWRKDHKGKPCEVCQTTETTVGAHIRHGSSGGMGLKPPDDLIMPLCRKHHAEEGDNQVAFWMKYKGWSIDQVKEIARSRYWEWKNG